MKNERMVIGDAPDPVKNPNSAGSKVWIIVLLILLIVGGGIYFVLKDDSGKSDQNKNITTETVVAENTETVNETEKQVNSNDSVTRETKEPEKVSSDTYTVQLNDCLWEIASRPEVYGNPKDWRKLYSINKISINDPNVIFVGQVLKLK